MSKMLWELKAPLVIAQAKEDMSVSNIFKYLRYYRMFLARFSWKFGDLDLTKRIENLLFWRGRCAFYNDSILGLVVGEIVKENVDVNGELESVDIVAENGYKRFNKKVGEEVYILYADETRFAPVLYIWSIANQIIDREDIINQQDNMLRKPIMVKGEGEAFDNACAKMINVLSGVAWFNMNPKGKASDNVLSQTDMEVLNLQVGNAYKGKELWESRGKLEELIKDYLGYMSVNNQKKERMINAEVNESNSICETFYKSAVNLREDSVKWLKSNGSEVDFKKNLEMEKEVEVNGNSKENMENSSSISRE